MLLNSCCKLLRPLSRPQSCARIGYYWGHDTLEEREARQKELKEKDMMMKWTNPKEEVDYKKEKFYSLCRIKTEENILEQTAGRTFNFNVVEYYAFVRQPILPYFFNPPYYRWKERIKSYEKLIKGQNFVRERVMALGPDLAAAHFLIARGCRVKFKDLDEWFEPSGRIPDSLPNVYTEGWFVEKIDASQTFLIYEGLQNIRNLICLKELDLSYSPLIDEWCLDRITGEYGESLEVLNLSGCTAVNWNGLEVLWRLRKLKRLILKDMEHIKDLKLICLMLLDVFPDLDIQGVDYIDLKLLEGSEHEHLLRDLDQTLQLVDGSVASKAEPN